jgi:hypothetical protein
MSNSKDQKKTEKVVEDERKKLITQRLQRLEMRFIENKDHALRAIIAATDKLRSDEQAYMEQRNELLAELQTLKTE